MTEIQTLRCDLETPPELCSVCRKTPMIALRLGLLVNGAPHDITICRDCLAEHVPGLLAEIEEAALDNQPNPLQH